MARVVCPECKNRISDRADKCPHCGLPAQYFTGKKTEPILSTREVEGVDYRNLGNILLSFDKDYCGFFSESHYITHREEQYMMDMYTKLDMLQLIWDIMYVLIIEMDIIQDICI